MTNAGFARIGFWKTTSQNFVYGYDATGDSFVVTARGDLGGDGVLSTFKLAGRVQENCAGLNVVLIGPEIQEEVPEE